MTCHVIMTQRRAAPCVAEPCGFAMYRLQEKGAKKVIHIFRETFYHYIRLI